jgi:alanine-synthesizing transaminase
MREPKLSDRTRWVLEENPLTRAIAAARAARPLIDLTESNPTRAGLAPGAEMLGELAHPRGASYEPVALGHEEARAAVVAYYRDKGVHVDAAHVALSASTSEAYAWLFKLLCDRDDAVLVPQPSYPLFDYLASLEDVRLVPYPLAREERFAIDLAALEAAIDARTRAILFVHPNNPTGTFASRQEADAIEALAAQHGLALIVDEVFCDYPHGELPTDRLPTFAGRARALTFVLSGLSKVVAMPQVKLGWIAVSGPDPALANAMGRLEVIADTYLSVATPIQRALPAILGNRAPVQKDIRARVATNLAALDAALVEYPSVRRLPSDGGWSAILEVPRTRDDESWAETLVREDGVVVHPGYFFDLDRDGFLVISLLPEPAAFARAIASMLARIEQG